MIGIAITACWTLASTTFNSTPAVAANPDDKAPQRDGDRPSPEREVRRDGDRPSREREVRRDGDRPRTEREVSTAELYNLVQQLRREVAMLRMEIRRLHARPIDLETDEPKERGPRELPRNPFGPREQ